jgi:hypothetical protein
MSGKEPLYQAKRRDLVQTILTRNMQWEGDIEEGSKVGEGSQAMINLPAW